MLFDIITSDTPQDKALKILEAAKLQTILDPDTVIHNHPCGKDEKDCLTFGKTLYRALRRFRAAQKVYELAQKVPPNRWVWKTRRQDQWDPAFLLDESLAENPPGLFSGLTIILSGNFGFRRIFGS